MPTPPNIQSLPGPVGERALVARIAAGEAPACRELYATHAPRLLRLLLRFFRGDRAAAEDVLQETFVAAFDALRTEAPESLGAWLTSIAVRRGLNAVRGEKRRVATLEREARGADWTDAAAPANQDAARLLALVDALDEPKRTTMLLFGEGHTAQEIADILGEPRGTVLARIARTRAALAARAVAEGLLDEDRTKAGGAR